MWRPGVDTAVEAAEGIEEAVVAYPELFWSTVCWLGMGIIIAKWTGVTVNSAALWNWSSQRVQMSLAQWLACLLLRPTKQQGLSWYTCVFLFCSVHYYYNIISFCLWHNISFAFLLDHTGLLFSETRISAGVHYTELRGKKKKCYHTYGL